MFIGPLKATMPMPVYINHHDHLGQQNMLKLMHEFKCQHVAVELLRKVTIEAKRIPKHLQFSLFICWIVSSFEGLDTWIGLWKTYTKASSRTIKCPKPSHPNPPQQTLQVIHLNGGKATNVHVRRCEVQGNPSSPLVTRVQPCLDGTKGNRFPTNDDFFHW